MKITVEGYSAIREEYLPVTVMVDLDRFGWLDGWELTEVEGKPVAADHASVWAAELGITHDMVEAVARKEAGVDDPFYS